MKYKVLKKFGDLKKGDVLDTETYDGDLSEVEAAVAEKVLKEIPESSDGSDDTEQSEKDAPASITPTGRFVVMDVEGGKRLFNEFGQAVSPVCSEASEIADINRKGERFNMFKDARNKK